MRTRPPQKTGVLGVLGVPNSLKAPQNKAYSHGTPTEKYRNTKPHEHQWCSEQATNQTGTLASPARHYHRASETTTQPQLSPVGRCSHDLHQHWAASYSADLARGLRGEGAQHATGR